ncbi:MAG: catalase, partial [Niameybacter sp.]
GRLLAYQDAQRYRVGVNSRQIPINAPKYANIYTTQRDGFMQVNGNMGNAPNYYPTTFADVEVTPQDAQPPIPVDGIIERHTIETDEGDFIQPGEFYRDYLDQEGKGHLIYNVVNSLKKADLSLQYRETALFYKCDQTLGELIAQFLKLDFNDVIRLANMSQDERVKHTMPKQSTYTTK